MLPSFEARAHGVQGTAEGGSSGGTRGAGQLGRVIQSSHLLGLRAFSIRLGRLPPVDFPIDLASTRGAGL